MKLIKTQLTIIFGISKWVSRFELRVKYILDYCNVYSERYESFQAAETKLYMNESTSTFE